MNSNQDILKSLPSVDRILGSGLLDAETFELGREKLKFLVRDLLDDLRSRVVAGDRASIEILRADDVLHRICDLIKKSIQENRSERMQSVFNLTGTIIHTNLGRSPLPDSAIEAIARMACEPCNLEYDLPTGKRGDRDSYVEEDICHLTGAEAATVVNNNAAAVLLVLNTFACGKEVLISRGELVEIGGSFRIPEVMQSANCTLHEVGATNRTHLKDYQNALNEKSGLVMKVHTSNYEIRGFVNSVADEELAQLAQKAGIPFVNDLGSGTLVDFRQFDLPHEPTVAEALEKGADLVTFSGDKLLGGPQAGLIVGSRELIAAVKKNPLKRALRVDKLTLAALAAVLKLYQSPAELSSTLPIMKDLLRPLADIEALAGQLLREVKSRIDGRAEVSIEPCSSQIGSGALPLDLLESRALAFTPIAKKGQSDAALQNLAEDFRKLPRPVIGRIHDGRLILDLRCLRDADNFLDQLSQLPT